MLNNRQASIYKTKNNSSSFRTDRCAIKKYKVGRLKGKLLLSAIPFLCLASPAFAQSAVLPSSSTVFSSQDSIKNDKIFAQKIYRVELGVLPRGVGDGPKIGSHEDFRFNENWCSTSQRLPVSIFDRAIYKTKCIPLGIGHDWYVTFSGEERLKYSYNKHGALVASASPKDIDSYLLRSQYGADIHMSKYFRTFVELISGSQFGVRLPKENPRNSDPLDVEEFFVEPMLPLGDGQQIGLRVGREKYSFGNGLLISTQGSLNIERSFNGVHAYYTNASMRMDIFASELTTTHFGYFDDHADQKHRLWGVYGSVALPRAHDISLNVDPFYVGYRNAVGLAGPNNFDGVSGVDMRNTFGARLWGEAGPLDVDWTVAHQSGSLGHYNVSAFAVWTETGIVGRGLPLKPELGFDYYIMGGGKSGHTVKTWNSPYQESDILTPTAYWGGSNLVELGPFMKFSFKKRMEFRFAYDFFSRFTAGDAVYTTTGPIPNSTTKKAAGSNYLASQPLVEMRWSLTPYLLNQSAIAYTMPSHVLKNLGVKSSLFASSTLIFLF